jgi:hypothetical protein
MWAGCEKQGTRVAPWGIAGKLWVCDEHFEVLNRAAEEEERKIKERKEKQERAIEEARELLTFPQNVVPFVVKEYEGCPDTYVTLGKKVQYEVYKELLSSGALTKDVEGRNVYYIITDEQKAAKILQKHGYKVILSSEWKEKHKRACEILRQAGVLPLSVSFV